MNSRVEFNNVLLVTHHHIRDKLALLQKFRKTAHAQ